MGTKTSRPKYRPAMTQAPVNSAGNGEESDPRFEAMAMGPQTVPLNRQPAARIHQSKIRNLLRN
jgi:hypothetical protein